jgi:hypothetical protein
MLMLYWPLTEEFSTAKSKKQKNNVGRFAKGNQKKLASVPRNRSEFLFLDKNRFNLNLLRLVKKINKRIWRIIPGLQYELLTRFCLR